MLIGEAFNHLQTNGKNGKKPVSLFLKLLPKKYPFSFMDSYIVASQLAKFRLFGQLSKTPAKKSNIYAIAKRMKWPIKGTQNLRLNLLLL